MTDAEIIERFGGPSKLGFLLCIDRRVVSNWKQRGIPKPWRHVLKQYAADFAIKLPKNFI
jgi:hypothetical protein